MRFHPARLVASLAVACAVPLAACATRGAAGPQPAGSPASPRLVAVDARARGLVRIGEDGIARANDAALDAYFAPGFVFHGPEGDMTFAQLKASFAALRASFSDFRVTREAIVVQGDLAAARTTMAGTFTGPFRSPYGVLRPTGGPMRRELINVFRYDARGRLAEEWVRNDVAGFYRQLGVVFTPSVPDAARTRR